MILPLRNLEELSLAGTKLRRWTLMIAAVLLPGIVAAEEPEYAEPQDPVDPVVLQYRIEDQTYRPFLEGMEEFGQQLSAATGGKITLKRRTGAMLNTSSDIVLDCILGTLDLALVPVNRLANIAPGPQILAVPYLLSRESFDSILQPGGNTIVTLLSEVNAKEPRLEGIDLWYGGYLQLLMRDHPALSPDDLKGQNMWVRGEGPDKDYLISMGAVPVEMSFSMGVEAAKRGYIDGIMLPVPMIDSNRLYRYMNYLSLTSHARMSYVMLMSSSTWKKLGIKEREIVRREAQRAGAFVKYLTNELEEINVNRLRHVEGFKVYDPDPELFRKHSEYVRELYIKTYPMESDLLRSELRDKGQMRQR